MANFFQTESVPEVYKEQLSEHDIVENNFQSTMKLENNKFQVDLPLKIPISDVNETLGESFDLALYRFLSLEKKLNNNSVLHSEYTKFINEYVELGHGHYINLDSYNLRQDPVYFLPHHAVINESSKTTRTRVVFDASMNTRSKVSLNDILLNGPVVQRDLFDIVILYRFGDYTFNADIKRMFRGVLVNPEHTSLQNILWREDPSQPIKCIRLDTVTYGLKSSSYLATRCLLELAKQNETNLPLAASIIKNCTYVDDVMVSHSNLNTLLEAKMQLTQLLALGSFELHKWSSNNKQVLSDIPTRLQQLDDIELQKENYNIKALGLSIDVQEDCFVITPPTNMHTQNITKRNILSHISRFYDPLGFVCPIVVKAKVIMQQLWLEKMEWDACPPQHIHDEWVQFSNNLASMDTIKLKRNIQIPSDAEAVQLIGFADASSSTGYGCCVYLRVVHSSGTVETSLLCSKSRINPRTKPLTVPRLELNACLLLAKLITRVHETLTTKIRVDDVYLFSDSQISLAWLKTEVTKLQAYVSNRVRVIQQLTNRWRWLYVNTQENPADLVSRGVDDPRVLASSTLWWNGPAFLQHREYSFNNKIQSPTELPELKPQAEDADHGAVILSCTLDQSQVLDMMIRNISDINKMQRILAYILRFCHNSKPTNTKIKTKFLSSNELQRALLLLIKHEQTVYYNEEIKCLLKGDHIKGSLKPLHPFLDEEGVLRVGGRLHNSDIPYTQKHPAILPKQSRLTQLIIRHEHFRLLHAGPKLLLAQINQKYWLVNGIRTIKKVIHNCLVCFRMKANTAGQLMGSLPKQRVTASRAFQVVGVDFAGPVQLKNSRIRRATLSKGYICVFVCFTTKAVHLELASDLSTDTFLACFKRFISRRSLPTEVFCDNGTAFVGARNKLTDLYKLHGSVDHQTQVQGFASQQGIKFHFIPAYSPVFAGLAEAAVKSSKYHLKRTIEKDILTYEQLNTVLSQIEAILNSRPIMPISSSDIADFSYLTPGHFLVGGPLVSYPEPDITEVPANRLKFWTLVENMKQCFWKAWHKQYLNILQSRPKWRDSLPNITVGSLVIMREPNSAPLYWSMARVTQIFPGGDGKVRALELKTSNGKTYTRSLSSVCILPLE
ncbi:uncharacterized protein LOC126368160 isoform X1 [Pectinophora gossypiella]|uniref:uncharacterized protein LOC126368160 isoform X1 n=1 Tax=Pectinophora gossypiella TaxID=13191 RepID=UPI00214F0EAA|nr:uncharacterized protein LOC126368160 isoform X1 [Pectinophora gossypiella]